MSLFMGGMASYEVDERKLELATMELDSMTALYTGIVNGCKAKCYPPYYTDEPLNKGETCCLDRCVSKFFRANLVVGEMMRSKDMSSATPAVTTPLATLGQHRHLE